MSANDVSIKSPEILAAFRAGSRSQRAKRFVVVMLRSERIEQSGEVYVPFCQAIAFTDSPKSASATARFASRGPGVEVYVVETEGAR
jgi:hypothetical protein